MQVAANHEWVKILLSTLAGLFAGLIAEPIRRAIQWRIDVLRMERAIHLDCLAMRVGYESTKVGLVSDHGFWNGLNLPAFDHHWNKNRELFYDRMTLYLLALGCQRILTIRSAAISGKITSEDGREQILTALEDIAKIKHKKGVLDAGVRRFLGRYMWE